MKNTIIGILIVFVLIFLMNALFIINEYEQAVITQFGRPVRVIAGDSPFTDRDELKRTIKEYADNNNSQIGLSFGAGIYLKIPFIQNVEIFEDRILEYDTEPAPITTKDKKRLILDNFARWRINDPLLFKQTLGTVPVALNRLDNIIKSELRNKLGEHNFIEIIRSTNSLFNDTTSQIPKAKLVQIETGRTKIMEQVTAICRETSKKYGIFIVDVRIKRADPPDENLVAIYDNMRSERERIAEEYKKKGERDKTIIMAETDRLVKTMVAEAERKASAIQGEADAEAAKIYASGFVDESTSGVSKRFDGFESNPEFYQFLRSLDALEITMDSNTNLILTTDNDLFKFLDQQTND